jgi:uncharacterized membrane protein
MNELVAYLGVLLAAATPWLEVLFVVPAGLLVGLPLAPTIAVAAIGNVVTLVPVVVAADRLETWWRRRRGEQEGSARMGRARRVLQRHGVPGLAAIGPLLTGAHLAALVAMAAGAERRRVLVWFSASIAVWAAVVGIATALGVDLLVDPDLVDRLPRVR